MSQMANSRYFRRVSSIKPTITDDDTFQTNPSRLLKNPQLSQIISQSSATQDVVFLECEVVDEKAEKKWADEKLRNKGLCVCQRWVCMVIGNLLIIAITCGLIGLLVYLNSITTISKQPLSYLQSCTAGSSDCDTIADLKCPSGTCVCNSNKVWNGTDCVCSTNQYWDGYNCLTNKNYGESCSTSMPCLSYLVCDNTTSLCNCSSTTYFSTQQCLTKKTNAATCSSYTECQTYLGLTCSSGTCQCYSRFYWNNAQCTAQSLNGINCASFPSIQCDSTLGLSCQSNLCACSSTNYWTGSTCATKKSYGTTCGATAECDDSKNLICSTTACTCPTTYAVGSCDCDGSTRFYDGQSCILKKTAGNACPGGYGCTSGTCTFGVCQ